MAKSKDSKGVIQCDKLSFAASEAYKLLRTNLQFAFPNDNKTCHIIGITSAIRGEGKSTTAVNLAYTLAQAGKRVLLIDADLRLPTVHTKLGVRGTPGLSNLLAGMVQSKDALVVSSYFKEDNWYILPAGDIPPNPSELLGSNRMRLLLESYSKAFNYILIDLPPVNVVTDAMAIASMIDGMMVVVRENHSTRSSLDACMYQMSKLGPKLLGFVMTDADMSKAGYGKRYGSRRRYGKRYGYGNYGSYDSYGGYGYGSYGGYGYGSYGGYGYYGSGYGYGYGKRTDPEKREAFRLAPDDRPEASPPDEES